MGWARVGAELRHVAAVGPLLVRHPSDLTTAAAWIAGRDSRLLHDGVPWWPRRAIRLVARLLAPGANVFEFGGGGSTVWLERQGAKVTTVEHDAAWADLLRKHTRSDRTTVLFEPPRPSGRISSDSAEGYFDDYVAAIEGVEGPFDLVIVDGRCRVAGSLKAKERVRPGGLLLLDDSHREKYGAVHEAMRGWRGHHVVGIKRGSREVVQTSIWERPIA